LLAAEAALSEAGGAPLLALEYGEGERWERRQEFLDRLAGIDVPALLELAQRYQHRLPEAWGWLSRWVHDLLAVQANARPHFFPAEGHRLQRLNDVLSPVELWHLQRDLAKAGRWLRHPLNGQLLLESWLLRYAQSQEASHG
jgi:DNA polymerase-3 subunit delta'